MVALASRPAGLVCAVWDRAGQQPEQCFDPPSPERSWSLPEPVVWRCLLERLAVQHDTYSRRKMYVKKDTRADAMLHRAAITGDVIQCQSVLDTGRVHVDCTDLEGTTPLILAAANGHLACVKELLRQGADPNQRRQTGATAVFFAAQAGHVEVLRALLRHGGKPATVTTDGASALFVASQCGHVVCVRELLQAGASVTDRMKDRSTPLFLAAQNGHHEVAVVLTDAGADPEQARVDGATPLWIASQMGRSRVVQHLLQAGAGVDTPRHDGATALFKAAHKGHVEVIRALLRHSPCVTVLPNGESALHAAAMFGHVTCAELLVSAGSRPDLQNAEGLTAAELALQAGFDRLAARLEGRR